MENNYYSHSNNKIIIAHFPGIEKGIYNDLIKECSNKIVNGNDNLDIVSINTKDTVNNSSLLKQLKNSNINYINPVEDKIVHWQAVDKVKYILQALNECNKEYTLILDGNDVVLLDGLIDIIDRFKIFKKDIIYNATMWRYPKIIVDYVKDRGQYGKYCFLNAGCCVGKTDKLIEFYQEVQEQIKNDYPTIDSEQYYVRKVFNKHQDTVFFDYECKIFQIWHNVTYTQDGDKIIVY